MKLTEICPQINPPVVNREGELQHGQVEQQKHNKASWYNK